MHHRSAAGGPQDADRPWQSAGGNGHLKGFLTLGRARTLGPSSRLGLGLGQASGPSFEVQALPAVGGPFPHLARTPERGPWRSLAPDSALPAFGLAPGS